MDKETEEILTTVNEKITASEKTIAYHQSLKDGVYDALLVAEKARLKGFDPKKYVEIYIAQDVATRTEGLVGPVGVAKRLKELEATGMVKDQIVIAIAREIASKKFGDDSPEKLADQAIRTALSYQTESVTAAPIEGISKVELKNNSDGSGQFLAVYYAGPIRSAGGTAQGVSIYIADVVRETLGLARYKATEPEVERMLEEVRLYNKIMHLQLPTSDDELRHAWRHIPIMIHGDATESEEVSGYRNITSMDTNRVRGGACLVMNDGLVGRAKKITKRTKKLKLEGWEWLEEIASGKFSDKRETDVKGETGPRKVTPDYSFASDALMGRPTFSDATARGGFRLRYGHARNTGIAAIGIHPATMAVVDDFLATGTHVRTERPGKGSIVVPINTIRPPIVMLKNGDVVELGSYDIAREKRPEIAKILFIGDMLVGVGEFLQNNYRLSPPGYNEEWWAQEMLNAGWDGFGKQMEDLRFYDKIYKEPPTLEEAIIYASEFNVPLHPHYTPAWVYLEKNEILELRRILWQSDSQILPLQSKEYLEKLFITHTAGEDGIDIGEFNKCLRLQLPNNEKLPKKSEDSMQFMQRISKLKIRDSIGTTIGARMGRPEKAKARLMKPMLHGLFPVGTLKKVRKELKRAIEQKNIDIRLSNRFCDSCNLEQINVYCQKCDDVTIPIGICTNRRCGRRNQIGPCDYCGGRVIFTKKYTINMSEYVKESERRLGSIPEIVKLKDKITNPEGIPEILDKAILRSAKNLNVFRDGTIRYDATDAPLTHFYPREIRTSVEKLVDLGYTHDIFGEPLTKEDQLLEMKVQDIIVHESSIEHLRNVAEFVDKELQYLYGLDPFYNINQTTDLLGLLVIGLAPHTSAGVIGRIIGFTSSSVCWAHPFWHSSKRRNCIEFNEELLLWDDLKQEFDIRPIGDIVNGVIKDGNRQKIIDDFGTIEIENPYAHLFAFGIDEKSRETILQPIKKWIKGSTDQWVKITTETGRTLTITPGHNQIIWEKDDIKRRKGKDLNIGDVIPTMFHLPDAHIDLQKLSAKNKINIVKELSEKLPHNEKFNEFRNNVRIRGIHNWLKEKLFEFAQSSYENENNGLILKLGPKQCTIYLRAYFKDKFPINSLSKQFDFKWYRTVPLSHLEIIIQEKILNWDDLPEYTMLGIARNNSSYNNYMTMGDNLIRLIGYYISEGHSRDDYGCHQLNFSVPNKELRCHMETLIQEVFNSKPYFKVDNSQLVHVSKIHMYLFTYAWKMGHSALTKRLPSFVYNLPRDLKLHLFSAIIDGNGSLIKSHDRITIYTGNERLKSDYKFLISTLGYFSTSQHVKEVRYGETVLQRYDFLNIDPKEGNGLFHINIYQNELKQFISELFLVHKEKKAIQSYFESRIDQSKKDNRNYLSKNILGEKIKNIEIIEKQDDTYCLEIDTKINGYHTISSKNGIFSGQCDGDEDGIILLMDGFLNFSKEYLPTTRGSKMDTPLVLVVTLNPNEVDDEAFNLDSMTHYGLEFYEAAKKMKMPSAISNKLVRAENKLGTTDQFEHFTYSHGTDDISSGPLVTRYKDSTLNIRDKLHVQLQLGSVIGAVNVRETALRILEKHTLPDLQGNLRAFASQKFRCVNCNTKYRRVPLNGKCKNPNCFNSKIILTVPPKGVSKYLDICEMLVNEYKLGIYHENRLERIRMSLDSLFPEDTVEVVDLSEWF